MILRIENCAKCKTLIDKFNNAAKQGVYNSKKRNNNNNNNKAKEDKIIAIFSDELFEHDEQDKKFIHTKAIFNRTHHSIENNYHTMQERQKEFVDSALLLCRQRGMYDVYVDLCLLSLQLWVGLLSLIIIYYFWSLVTDRPSRR